MKPNSLHMSLMFINISRTAYRVTMSFPRFMSIYTNESYLYTIILRHLKYQKKKKNLLKSKITARNPWLSFYYYAAGSAIRTALISDIFSSHTNTIATS